MNAHVVMHPAEQKRQARKKLMKVADRLSWALDQIIASLDEIDGDADFEPSLAAVASLPQDDQRDWAAGANDNREDDGLERGELDLSDAEPSLGAIEAFNQRRWGISPTDDLEAQCEDEGFDSDTEGHAY